MWPRTEISEAGATGSAELDKPLSGAHSLGQAELSVYRDIGLIVLFFGVLYFSLLGGRPLANPDEGRYTEIPREMIESGDYLTPRLNGVRYFEKPPLVYWATALGIEVFGLNEFGARFWCTAFAVFGIVATYLFSREQYGRGVAVWASITLGTSLLYMGLSQIVLLDMVITVLVSGALFAFLGASGMGTGKRKTKWLMAFYSLMGLAVMTKGLIGLVIPVAVIGIWIVVGNRWKEIPSYRLVSGLLVFLVVTVPWHVAVALENPDFLEFYFVHEHFLRYTTQVHSRVEPWWFFIPIVLAGFFPWVTFLPQAIRRCFPQGWKSIGQDRATSFLLIWIGFVVLFFSISQSKLVPYVLPIFPALAVVVGRFLGEIDGERKSIHRSILVYVGISWLLAIGVTLVGLPEKYSDHIGAVNAWRIALSTILAVSSLCTFVLIRFGNFRWALTSMTIGSAAFFLGLLSLYGVLESKSTKHLADYLVRNASPDAEVYCLGRYYQDLPVYLNRKVNVVDYEGELSFGINSEPEVANEAFFSREDFAAKWRTEIVQYAIVRKDMLLDWADEIGPHVRVLSTTRRYALIINENGEK